MKHAIVERNLDLTAEVMRFIVAHPEVLAQLPADFRLVLLPDNEPELARYNLDLLGQDDPAHPAVLVRLSTQRQEVLRPQVYVPVPV